MLIIDDDQFILSSLKRLIEKNGYEATISNCGKDALNKIKKHHYDIAFLDYRLPDMSGLEIMKTILEITPEIVIIFFSAFGTIKTVVNAVKMGAFDYLQKPYKNDEILLSLMRANEHIKLTREVSHLKLRNQATNPPCSNIIAESEEIRRVLDMAKNVSKSPDTPVLIQGETGTGKEVIAHTIHYNSPRRDGPFLKINCAAIPKDLIESELFGHEKGAFTGADQKKLGFFELANGGTLLLDEIGEINMQAQVKLMRVLENKTYFKVGGTTQEISDARVVASTNRDLSEEVKKGNFREDLFFRLNVITIRVPSMKMRRRDIIPLVKYFMEIFSTKFNKKVNRISQAALDVLINREWRGNVREIKNIMERVVLLADKTTITPEMLMLDDYNTNSETVFTINLSDDGISMDEITKGVIEKALKITKGNQLRAAKMLGLSRGRLRYGISKYNIAL
ncbi:sigma-54-dependent transcriptional regulator [Desulfosarcina cetonica]|uniref:sigma-54-dependent transcriptional regulator n=1 Tax=Desulfosarcina cetonica TaxID=90730 RepID=UPI0006D0BAA5|nr:sigma-54 dependent transcriptional regulator [Desulfosarcina cetonica]